ncbi:MAG: hypothetical protein HKN70_00445 [Gammaproteobacteria bacterium]|nr:hypothetical protein [Gammaproteobacteria bacterium]
MRDFFPELKRRDRLLFAAGSFQMILFCGALVASFVDPRTVLGANTWIKPMKFSLSVGVYIWTIAWFIGYLHGRPRWVIALIRWGITLSMLIEMTCIFLQAARGTPSHFNVSTGLDGTIFALMGIMIGINMVLVFILLVTLFLRRLDLAPVYLWSIRLGILVFFLGSWIGSVMIGQMSHAVGVADGGPGLPLLGWSTTGGDLRIAHGLGLHALQLIPLCGYALTLLPASVGTARRIAALSGATVLYAGATVLLYLQAQAGLPLLAGG